MKENIFDIIIELAQEISNLKENECENSGYNWYFLFYIKVRELEDKINKNKIINSNSKKE